MTEKQLEHANGIRKQIDITRESIKALDTVENFRMRDDRNWDIGIIGIKQGFMLDKVRADLLPAVLNDQIKEQFIKAIQRSKRLLENFEHELKQELEDL